MDEYGVVGAPSCAHDLALIDVFDVASLHGESVHDDGEVRYLATIFFKSLGALDCVSILVGSETGLEILDGDPTARSDSFKVSAVFSLLGCKSLRKSTIPSCLGRGQCSVNMVLDIISFFSEGGDEVLVLFFAIDGTLQLVDSRASDVLGQGSNGLGGELVLPVVDESEGALGIDDGGLGHLQDFG